MIIALGKFNDPRVFEPLLQALKSDYYSFRLEAAIGLGNLKDKRAVVALIEVLKKDSWEIKREAAIALGEIGDKRAVEPLVAHFMRCDSEDILYLCIVKFGNETISF